MLEYSMIFVAGLVGGFLAGFLGLGGGLAYILILPNILAMHGVADADMAQFVIANSLFGAMFASLSGNVEQVREKVFLWREVFYVSIGGVLSSLGFLYFVVYTDWYDRQKFTVVVVAILLYILIHTIRKGRQESKKTLGENAEKRTPMRLLLAGLFSGGISSLSGLGGGVLIIPAVRKMNGVGIRIAKSISLGVIFVTSFFLTISNMLKQVPESAVEGYNIGYVVMPIALPLVAGTVLASPLGVKLSMKVSPKVISVTFAIFVALLIVKYSLAFF